MKKKYDDRVWLIDQPTPREEDEPSGAHYRAINAAGRVVCGQMMSAYWAYRAAEHRTVPPWCANIRLPEFRLDRVAGDWILIPASLRVR